MAAITETKRSYLPRFPSAKTSLPLSHPDGGVLRRRLSSLSLSLKPMSASTASWAIRRSKSVSSAGALAGSSIRTWWDSVWAWVLSRKPLFARDLELNEEESKLLGSQSRGSWRHVLYKVRREIRRLVSSDNVSLPQTCRYDCYSSGKNSDKQKRFQSY